MEGWRNEHRSKHMQRGGPRSYVRVYGSSAKLLLSICPRNDHKEWSYSAWSENYSCDAMAGACEELLVTGLASERRGVFLLDRSCWVALELDAAVDGSILHLEDRCLHYLVQCWARHAEAGRNGWGPGLTIAVGRLHIGSRVARRISGRHFVMIGSAHAAVCWRKISNSLAAPWESGDMYRS